MARGTERILVVGPAWVGDMIMAQSLYKSLKIDRSGVRIDVLAPDWSLPLLERMPEVDSAVRLSLGHGELGLGERYRVGRMLRERRYDRAIILPRSLKAALVPFFARVRRRTGYRGEMRVGLLNDIRPLDEKRMPMAVQRFVALGQPANAIVPPPNIACPSLRVDERNRKTLLDAWGLNTKKPIIAFAPGAEYGPAKRWPTAAYAKLASRLAKQGNQVWLFGSEKDRPVADEIASITSVVNLCGRTSLTDAIDLLSLVTLMVSNDSGLMHMAAAVGRPVVGIYGSSSPVYTPPLGRHNKAVYNPISCGPCFERTCKFGHYRCLTEVSVEQVESAVSELMDG